MSFYIYSGNEKLIILMRNVIGNLKDNMICKFDLKGSTAGRKEKINEENVNKVVMKDLNFEEIEKVFMISDGDVIKLRDISKKDANFFEQLELMDYSLFVIKIKVSPELHNIIVNTETNDDIKDNSFYPDIKRLKKHLYPSLIDGVWYIISIIDYFQTYNFLKLMETGYKSVLAWKLNNKDISCVEPSVYAKRFADYIERITDVKKIMSIESIDIIQQSNT